MGSVARSRRFKDSLLIHTQSGICGEREYEREELAIEAHKKGNFFMSTISRRLNKYDEKEDGVYYS